MKMRIVDFTCEHIGEASVLAISNYKEERSHIPILPFIDTIPDLSGFADNELGVAAFDGNRMIGFLCCYKPFNNAFGISGVRGVFSPMGSNGAIHENRANIFAGMYQAAGEKWVRAGAVSHAVCLYAHDKGAQEQFFRYGFGLRCIDAIRDMEEIDLTVCDGYEFSELKQNEIPEILPLENMHVEGYIDSPFFMFRKTESENNFLKNFNHKSIYFIARYEGKIIAYIMAELDGETFIKEMPGYLHVKGAFCMPEHRRKGVSQHLLSLLVKKLKTQGYTCLGVDFESYNPLGSGFWLKHFTAYTHSVVRRIDENVLGAGI